MNGRWSATSPDRPAVVFLIGMRVNRPLAVHKWLPVFVAMPRMIRELASHQEKGLLHTQYFLTATGPGVLQYWRSLEDLHRYAHDPQQLHLPAWRRFNRRIGNSGAVGIWHETYVVRPGSFEVIYDNMPPTGLGAALGVAPVAGATDSARDRLRHDDSDSR